MELEAAAALSQNVAVSRRQQKASTAQGAAIATGVQVLIELSEMHEPSVLTEGLLRKNGAVL